MIRMGKSNWVLTRDQEQPSYLCSATNRELVTVFESVSGGGAIIPLMVILHGKVHQEHWCTKAGHEDCCLVAASDSGYTNDHLALRCLAHFEKFTRPKELGAYRLLLMYGLTFYGTNLFVGYCYCHRIRPFFLEPHETHLVQPLDVVLFQPYKHYHAEAVDEATRIGRTNFNRIQFLVSLTSIRQQTFTVSSILSSFHRMPLIPFEPSIVHKQMHEAQWTTEKK